MQRLQSRACYTRSSQKEPDVGYRALVPHRNFSPRWRAGGICDMKCIRRGAECDEFHGETCSLWRTEVDCAT